MSKIYEALRRHERRDAQSVDMTTSSRGPIVRALESIYPVVYRLAQESGRGLVLHFVAASTGEGVSTLSSEFALISARMAESRVLLIDADRLQLTTATKFGCAADPGMLAQIQAGGPAEAKVVVKDGDNTALQVGVLCAKNSPPLSRKALPTFYEQCRAKYEITIIDCPAVFSDRYFEHCPEAADGVIFVVQAERSRPEITRQAQAQIESAGGKFIGAILNRRHNYIPHWLYRLL